MIVWCMLTVFTYCTGSIPCAGETAVKGKVIKEEHNLYLINFFEYAFKQGYLGDWSEPRLIKKDVCIKE